MEIGYVRGIGRTRFGILDENLQEMMYTAVSKALKDASFDSVDIDMIFIANFVSGILQNQQHLGSILNNVFNFTGKPIVRIESACASGGGAFYQALIALNKFRNILVIGVEKMSNIENKLTTKALASADDNTLYFNEGLVFPATFALITQQYMLNYGTTAEDLALVSYKNHKNARLNPLAHFSDKDVTMDMIKSSAIVCSPLRLFDCSPISDGAAAVIISKGKNSDRDIAVVGSSLCTDYCSLAQRENLTSFSSAKKAAYEAYRQANIKPGDLDLIEVHDCFTISELIALEDLDVCKPGESKDLVRNGYTDIGGTIPVNTDGGLKADGHPVGATGIAQIYEVVTQLREEAGGRQINSAEIALTHNIGGVGGTTAINIFMR
ncbi:MAG: thiolase domain-containing protein [Actinobacteria bacterium]|nr:thiolase domain-containing protein [Actinomycetota bacterium]